MIRKLRSVSRLKQHSFGELQPLVQFVDLLGLLAQDRLGIGKQRGLLPYLVFEFFQVALLRLEP